MTARERAERAQQQIHSQWPGTARNQFVVIIEEEIIAAEDRCTAMAQETAKKLVQHMAIHMERESFLLYPDPATIMMDPYGLLDLIRAEGGFEPSTIDEWMVEAQKSTKE